MDDNNFVTTEDVEKIIEKAITSNFEKMYTRLTEAQEERMNSFKQEVGDVVSDRSSSWIDQIIEEAEEGGYNDDEYEEDDDDGDSQNGENWHSVVEQLKAQIEEERQARIEAEERQHYTSLVGNAIEAINKTGKVRNPNQLLRLLEEDGFITESEEGEFVATIKDEYGIKKTVPFAQAIDNFLASDEFSHFAIARPGSGTGAEPGGMELPAPDITERLLNQDNIKGASPEDFGKMLSQLDKAAKGAR